MKLPKLPPGWQVYSTSTRFAALDGAFFQVELVGDLAVVADQAVVLEKHLRLAEIEEGQLGVGRLALVLVAEASAQADDALRQGRARGGLDGPAGDVHLVDALVADLAVAEIPEPVPVVMHDIAVVRLLPRRAEPNVEVQFRRRVFRLGEPDAATRLAGVAVGDQQLAVLAAGHGRDLLVPTAVAAALGAVLDDALVLRRGLDQLAALEDVMAARLLHVDVFAGLAGPNGDQRMPVVGRGDRHRVEFLVVQGLADVLDALGRVAATGLDRVGAGREQPTVGIDQVGDLDAFHAGKLAHVAASAAVDAGHAQPDRVVGAEHLPGTAGAGDGEGGRHPGGGGGPFEECTTCLAGHAFFLSLGSGRDIVGEASSMRPIETLCRVHVQFALKKIIGPTESGRGS